MEILRYPDPKLTYPNRPLGVWSNEASVKVEEMRLLLSKVHGAGLAAPQVGWNVQLFILSIAGTGGETLERVVFDPTMIPLGEKVVLQEGCLSFPGMWAAIERYDRVRLMGQTPEGPIDEVLIDFEAQAVQHEMDHLNGILFIDRMTPADRKKNEPALKALESRFRG